MLFTIKLAQRRKETCYLAAARHKFYSTTATSPNLQGTKLEDSMPLISQPATGLVHIPATYFSKIQFDVIQTSHSHYSD